MDERFLGRRLALAPRDLPKRLLEQHPGMRLFFFFFFFSPAVWTDREWASAGGTITTAAAGGGAVESGVGDRFPQAPKPIRSFHHAGSTVSDPGCCFEREAFLGERSARAARAGRGVGGASAPRIVIPSFSAATCRSVTNCSGRMGASLFAGQGGRFSRAGPRPKAVLIRTSRRRPARRNPAALEAKRSSGRVQGDGGLRVRSPAYRHPLRRGGAPGKIPDAGRPRRRRARHAGLHVECGVEKMQGKRAGGSNTVAPRREHHSVSSKRGRGDGRALRFAPGGANRIGGARTGDWGVGEDSAAAGLSAYRRMKIDGMRRRNASAALAKPPELCRSLSPPKRLVALPKPQALPASGSPRH